jgi:hypothetical protein
MLFIWSGEPIAMTIPSALPPPAAPSPIQPPPHAARPPPPPLASVGEPAAADAPRQPEGTAALDALGGLPNPTIRMDPALGIVVLEFRDQRGSVRSIPTERELDAYRQAAARHERGEQQWSSSALTAAVADQP